MTVKEFSLFSPGFFERSRRMRRICLAFSPRIYLLYLGGNLQKNMDLTLPPQIYMIPQYLFFSFLGWVGTFKPLYVPYWLAGYLGPFYIFLLRQFFLTIPRELDDAALIDGCSWFSIYARIMLPLAKPAFIAAIIFCFTWTWNDFLTPLIYLNSREKYTITLGLRYFQSQYGLRYIRELMTASTISALPTLLLFFFFQKYFVEGISLQAIKK